MLDLTVTEVSTQEPVGVAVPDNVRTAAENVAVEQTDQIVPVESPLYDRRALAVFAAANKLVAGR